MNFTNAELDILFKINNNFNLYKIGGSYNNLRWGFKTDSIFIVYSFRGGKNFDEHFEQKYVNLTFDQLYIILKNWMNCFDWLDQHSWINEFDYAKERLL